MIATAPPKIATTAKHTDFNITMSSWHEVTDKLFPNLNPIQNLLNQSLKLERYGTAIKRLNFIFIAQRPSSNFFQNTYDYQPQTQSLTIEYLLPYSKIKESSIIENQSTMIQSFLAAISPDCLENQIKDFDFQVFYKDAKSIFMADNRNELRSLDQ